MGTAQLSKFAKFAGQFWWQTKRRGKAVGRVHGGLLADRQALAEGARTAGTRGAGAGVMSDLKAICIGESDGERGLCCCMSL